MKRGHDGEGTTWHPFLGVVRVQELRELAESLHEGDSAPASRGATDPSPSSTVERRT